MSDNVVDLEAQRKKRARLQITESSLARVFVDQFGEDLRYDHQRELWFVWDGARWRADDSGRVLKLIDNLAVNYAVRAPQRLQKELGGRRFVANVEWFARIHERVAVTSPVFDRHPLLLGTPLGAVNLKTGDLLRRWVSDPAIVGGGGWVQRSKRALITRATAVAPGEDGEKPRLWLQFLRESLRNDEEMLRFVQVMLGYCLTGSIKEHALFFLYGPGGNGKSVFVDTVVNIMGEYATVAPMEAFTATEAQRHETELAMLDGARLVVASETERGQRWAQSRIKQLTGGDPITARFVRKDFFTFRPKFKLVMSGNHRPVLGTVDDAMRRRMRLLAWLNKPARPDDGLPERLRPEYPAILRWMIEGARAWVWEGLPRSAAVVSSTEDYLADEDTIGQWIAEKLSTDAFPVNPQSMTRESIGALFASWCAFCEKEKIKFGRKNDLSSQLSNRGFIRKAGMKDRVFIGLAIRNGGGEGPLFD